MKATYGTLSCLTFSETPFMSRPSVKIRPSKPICSFNNSVTTPYDSDEDVFLTFSIAGK